MVESTVKPSSEVVVSLTDKETIQVLHVDDDASFLKVAKQCLKMQGRFQVETAVSVEEAMEKMKEKTFDVIISDYLMPGKCIVKVVLSKEQKEILDELARRLGTSKSETLRMALMDYAKELSLVTERIRMIGRRFSER